MPTDGRRHADPAAPEPAPTPAGPAEARRSRRTADTGHASSSTGSPTSRAPRSSRSSALTLLSVAPAILLICTSFTKIFVVLGLTRNALGLQQTPPNQVLAGLALFLSLFIMAPVLTR